VTRDCTAALAQAEATHRAGFVSQNFVKLMCSYKERLTQKELFRELSVSRPNACSFSAAIVVIFENGHFFGTKPF
jgi:hypothetical protein